MRSLTVTALGYLRLGIQGFLRRGASSGSLEMNPAPIQIVSRHRFEDMFLKSSHHWVISIREADARLSESYCNKEGAG